MKESTGKPSDPTRLPWIEAEQAKRDIDKIADMAVEDLLNAFSCYKVACGSPRAPALIANAREYLATAIDKANWALKLVPK